MENRVSLGAIAAGIPQVISFNQFMWDDLGADYLISPKSSFPEHTHQKTQVTVLFTQGTIQAHWNAPTQGNCQKDLKNGDVCLFPAGQLHNLSWEGYTELISFFISPEYVEQLARQLNLGEIVEIEALYGVSEEFIQKLALKLRTLLKGKEVERSQLEAYIKDLTIYLLQTYGISRQPNLISTGGLSAEVCHQIITYISENLDKELNLNQIANLTHISPFYFARAFKQTMGVTVHQYITARRIEQAKVLLRESDVPIIEIALQVGFQNQSHFTALFRKLTDITPNLYRAQNRYKQR